MNKIILTASLLASLLVSAPAHAGGGANGQGPSSDFFISEATITCFMDIQNGLDLANVVHGPLNPVSPATVIPLCTHDDYQSHEDARGTLQEIYGADESGWFQSETGDMCTINHIQWSQGVGTDTGDLLYMPWGWGCDTHTLEEEYYGPDSLWFFVPA